MPGMGFWGTVNQAAKTMDPNSKEGGEFKLPEQKEGRKASAPKNTMRKRFKKLKKQDRNALKY